MAEKHHCDQSEQKAPERISLEEFDRRSASITIWFNKINFFINLIIEVIFQQMAQKFELLFGNSQNEPQSIEVRMKHKKLDTLDLNGVAKYIKTCKNIVLINGAGISTSVGIPDFRSPNFGLFSQQTDLGISSDISPETVFNIDYFKNNPTPFYKQMKFLFPLIKNPSLSHYFQSLLVKKGLVRKIYTQNIDDLEIKAGINTDTLIQGHGSLKSGYCMNCKAKYSFDWMKKNLIEKEFMQCENKECHGLVRPDIVMFGETMPEQFQEYENDLKQCDCLIVTGTSLKVHPFSILPKIVPFDCPRVLINRDAVGVWENSVNQPERNYRDPVLIGECDEIYLKLADRLGFRKELDQMVQNKSISRNLTEKPNMSSSKKNYKK